MAKILERDPPTPRSRTKSTSVQSRNWLNFCRRTPDHSRKFWVLASLIDVLPINLLFLEYFTFSGESSTFSIENFEFWKIFYSYQVTRSNFWHVLRINFMLEKPQNVPSIVSKSTKILLVFPKIFDRPPTHQHTWCRNQKYCPPLLYPWGKI